MSRANLFLTAGAIALALLLVAPFFFARRETLPRDSRWMAVPVTHDMRQHISVLRQLDAAIRTGELYPRWQPEFNKGYGLPWLNYYPPAFYWFTEIFHAATGHALDAMFLVCALMMAGSGFASYALARQFFSTRASLVAAAFYMIAPYHNLDLYWRGALPELAGFVFVPLILLLAHRAGTRGGLRWIAALGLAHGAYLMTHIPVAYLLTLTLGLYAVLWAVLERNARIATRILGGVAWGFAASVVYWLVAVLERKHVQDTLSVMFQYHRSYIVLWDGDPFQTMLNATFVALALALIAALVVLRGVDDTQQRLFRILAVATLFMVTPYSVYVAKLIPNINSVSFAWRWMVIAALFVALMIAMAFERHPRSVIVIAALIFNVATSVRLMVRAFDNPDLDAATSYVEAGFVPGRAGDPEKLPANVPPAALVPDGRVEIVRWDPLHRELVATTTRDSLLRLRTYRFRGWTAHIDGHLTPLGMDGYGAQTLPLPPGTHRIVVTYENPRTRRVLGWVSVLVFLAAAISAAVDFRRVISRMPSA